MELAQIRWARSLRRSGRQRYYVPLHSIPTDMSPPTFDRTREDIFKELELVLEAKKNINTILTTMYSVFFSVAAFLVYAFYTLESFAGRITVSFFGFALMLGLMAVTRRARGTNSRCDDRARELEKTNGLKVIWAYDVENEAGFFGKLTMHSTLMVVDALFAILWVTLAILLLAHQV